MQRYFVISESAEDPTIRIPWEIDAECYDRILQDLISKGHEEKYFANQNAWGINLKNTGIYRWEDPERGDIEETY